MTSLKVPHCWKAGPAPGKAKEGVRSHTLRSNTLGGRIEKGTCTTCDGGPKVTETAELIEDGEPVGKVPSVCGCSGSVKVTRIDVCGSTSV